MVGSAKSCGIIGTPIQRQLASISLCIHSLLNVHLLNFLARSCKILQIRGFLGKNLGKILTKKSRTIQDSYQGLQAFLHWEVFMGVQGYVSQAFLDPGPQLGYFIFSTFMFDVLCVFFSLILSKIFQILQLE